MVFDDVFFILSRIIRDARKWYTTEEELDQFNSATTNLSLGRKIEGNLKIFADL